MDQRKLLFKLPSESIDHDLMSNLTPFAWLQNPEYFQNLKVTGNPNPWIYMKKLIFMLFSLLIATYLLKEQIKFETYNQAIIV